MTQEEKRHMESDMIDRGLKLRAEFYDPKDDSMLDNESVSALICESYKQGASDQFQIDEQRHAKELQALKDRAIETFKLHMVYWYSEYSFPELNDFIQKLNKQ